MTDDFTPRRAGLLTHLGTFLVCGLLAVCVRTLFLQDPVLSDDMGYWRAGDAVAAGDWRSLARGRGYNEKRWGMILPVAVVIRLLGNNQATYYFLPMAAAFLSGGLAYLIGRRIAGWTEGVIASVFYALIPLSAVANGPLLLPDSISSAWMAAAFWAVLCAEDRRRRRGQILCGLAGGLCVAAAYACRVTGLYAVPILVILALWRRRPWALIGLAAGIGVGLAGEFILFGVLNGDPLHRFHVASASYYKKWKHHNRVEDVGVLFGRYSQLLAALKDRTLFWKLTLCSVPVLLMLGRRRQNFVTMWFVAMVGMIHLAMRLEGGRDYLAALAAVVAWVGVVAAWVITEAKRTHRRRWRQPLPWWIGGIVALGVFLWIKQYPIQRALVHQVRYFEMAAIPGCLLIAMALTRVSRAMSRLWRPLPMLLAGVMGAGIIGLIVWEPYVQIRIFAEHRRTVLLVIFGGALAAAALLLLFVQLLSNRRHACALSFAAVMAAGLWGLTGLSLLDCEQPILISGGYARQIGRVVTEQRAAGARRVYWHNYLGPVARIFGEDVQREDLHAVSTKTFDAMRKAPGGAEATAAFPPDSLVLMDSNDLFITDVNRRRKARAGGPPAAPRLDELPAMVPANWQLLDVRNLVGKPRILIWRIHPEGRAAGTPVPILNGDFADWPEGQKLPDGFSVYRKNPKWSARFEKARRDNGSPAIRMILETGNSFWLRTGTAPHREGDDNAIHVVPDAVYRLVFRAVRPPRKDRVRLRVRIFQFDRPDRRGTLVGELAESFDVFSDWSVRTYPFRTHPEAYGLRLEFSPHQPNEITMADLRLIRSHPPGENPPPPTGDVR